MTVNSARAYCDEAGNTGANLLDSDQPLFVMGGWLVLDPYIKAAQEHIREYVGLLARDDLELHGARLLRSDIGTFGMLNLVQDLIHA